MGEAPSNAEGRTIVVAGAGFVGGRLCEMLAAAGAKVVGLVKSGSGGEVDAPFPTLCCDISDARSVAALGEAPELDCAENIDVVHAASSGRGGAEAYQRVYVGGVRNLATHLRRGKGRLVYCSSTSVYAQADGSVVTEESPAAPDRETGQILREAEDITLGEGGVVARLAGLYGPGRWHVLKKLLEGRAAIEGGAPGRYLNQLHREDAASALAHLLLTGHSGIFNVGDSQPTHQAECLRWLAEQCGLPMPPEAAADLNRKRGWTDKQVSNSKLTATGWQPQFPSFRDAFRGDPNLVPSIREASDPQSSGRQR